MDLHVAVMDFWGAVTHSYGCRVINDVVVTSSSHRSHASWTSSIIIHDKTSALRHRRRRRCIVIMLWPRWRDVVVGLMSTLSRRWWHHFDVIHDDSVNAATQLCNIDAATSMTTQPWTSWRQCCGDDVISTYIRDNNDAKTSYCVCRHDHVVVTTMSLSSRCHRVFDVDASSLCRCHNDHLYDATTTLRDDVVLWMMKLTLRQRCPRKHRHQRHCYDDVVAVNASSSTTGRTS